MRYFLLAAALLPVALAGCSADTITAGDTESNKEAIRRYWNGKWNDRDPGILAELQTSDVAYHGPGTETFGLAAYQELYGGFLAAFSDSSVTIEDLIAEDDKVVSRVVVTGVHSGPLGDIPPTGNTVSVALTTVFRFENGRIAEEFESYDELGLLTQVGMTIAPR